MTGIKHDKEKIRPRLIINSMARALKAVSEVGTFGANKYADDNWMEVPDGVNRYTDAMYRHLLSEAEGELVDPESGLAHAAHACWNCLARLDLMIREQEYKSPDARDYKFSVESEITPESSLEFAYDDDESTWVCKNMPEYSIQRMWDVSNQSGIYTAYHSGCQLSGSPFKEWQEAYDRCQLHYQRAYLGKIK